MSHSRASRAALTALGKSSFASPPRLSVQACATGAFVQARHNTSTRPYTTLPRAPSHLPVQQAPTADGPGGEPSVMPQQSRASQADFGPPKHYDWAESVYNPSFGSQPAPACPSQSSKPTSSHTPDSGSVRCNTNFHSRDSLILASDSSPLSPAAASSKNNQSSTSAGTAVPNGSDKSRDFVWHGNPIFAKLNKDFPPSQSRYIYS